MAAQAQKAINGLRFCSGVDSTFAPINPTTEISLVKGEAYLFFYYWSESPFSTTSLTYRTYALDEQGRETLTGTIQEEVNPAWRMVKQNAYFTRAGTYRVKVFNGRGNELTAALLTVK